jgi:N utilization substance protein B
MASNRHLGRIVALQTLYEQDFRREAGDVSFDLEEVLARNVDRYQKMVDDRAFIEALVRGVAGQEAELDKQLQPIAPEWPIDQIARMDRVILRMGLYELSVPRTLLIKQLARRSMKMLMKRSAKALPRKRQPNLPMRRPKHETP